MKVLIDTNVFIPLEPGAISDFEPTTPYAMALFRTAQELSATVYLHPLQRQEVLEDTDLGRREIRSQLFNKYPELPSPPKPSGALLAEFGNPAVGSNDWIDAHLVAALQRDVVHLLVTEDKEIHKRCNRLMLSNRCRTIQQALAQFEDELPVASIPPPAVNLILAHELIDTDQIFESFRADYGAEKFDDWLAKCRSQHRVSWTVQLPGRANYAAIAIVNPEDKSWQDAHNPTLKICSFKVADDAHGIKLGELLLKTVFDYAADNNFASLFIETFPKQATLLHLLEQFGFQKTHEKPNGEIELRKRLKPWGDVSLLSSFEFHRQFGPHKVKVEGTNVFLVPIEPRFHAMLFPDLQKQKQLFPGTAPYGNAIRKAYVCNSNITKLEPGSLLLFYRSQDVQEVGAAGVVDDTLRTSNADELEAFVGKRTVFAREDIEAKTARGDALGILFRFATVLRHNLPLRDLVEAGAVTSAPQSIQQLKEEAIPWIQRQLK